MFDNLMENWELFLSSIIAVSAFLCAFLPPATEESSKIYQVFHNILNYLAFNVGQAQNKA